MKPKNKEHIRDGEMTKDTPKERWESALSINKAQLTPRGAKIHKNKCPNCFFLHLINKIYNTIGKDFK